MFKNIVIAIQSAILIFGALFAHLYQHRVEQIFTSDSISNLANEARFKFKIADRIRSGQSADAERMLRNVAAENIRWAKNSVAELDLRMDDLASDAQNSAHMLDEIGVHDLSKALEEHRRTLKGTSKNPRNLGIIAT